MKTDKQLLALNKTDLLKEYRELESKLQELSANSQEPTLEEAIKIVQDNDMIVRKKQHYNF
nr:MAG TPA: Hexamethylene bis-acetamide-inducible protein [Caudoviricetes sp.]